VRLLFFFGFIIMTSEGGTLPMMNQETINFILQRMVVFLDNAQMLKLKDILDEIARQEDTTLLTKSSEELLEMFLATKRLEGRSENTLDKGMPVEQVQKLLGHDQIDTTMQYAMVKQSNVKIFHKRYIG
jgi:hypothetical protein